MVSKPHHRYYTFVPCDIQRFKSSFKKICLANFTQEFSLAVINSSYTRFSNNPFIIVQGVCSSLRYSIYKVHCALSCGQLAYNTTVRVICQELISSFFKFLIDLLFSATAQRRLRDITTTQSFCQAFLFVFRFFASPLRTASIY